MTSIALTETQILGIVYTLYEGDTTGWTATSAEYLSGRVYANTAINRWEHYEQTNWRELWGTLTAAADGTKTLTAGTYSYICPSNMVKPASYVRTVNSSGNSTYWDVVTPDRVPSLVKDTSYHYCYFTGNVKSNFYLNFNPLITLTTGNTINYEYYKTATTFTATTSTTEMTDPYFIVYFVLSRFYENDGSDDASKAFQEAEARLEAMRTNNMIGYEGVDDKIESTLSDDAGFGY